MRISVSRSRGGYAEFTVAKENETALKPKNISFEQHLASLPLTDTAKAHQQIETHHTHGKIVLKVAGAPHSHL